MRMAMGIGGAAVLAAAAVAATAETPKDASFRIEFNPKGEVIKDVSKSPCFPDLGLAGENTAPGIFNDAYLSYVKNREMTARAYREAGVWLVRPCGMLDHFAGIAKHPGKDWTIDEKTGRRVALQGDGHSGGRGRGAAREAAGDGGILTGRA